MCLPWCVQLSACSAACRPTHGGGGNMGGGVREWTGVGRVGSCVTAVCQWIKDWWSTGLGAGSVAGIIRMQLPHAHYGDRRIYWRAGLHHHWLCLRGLGVRMRYQELRSRAELRESWSLVDKRTGRKGKTHNYCRGAWRPTHPSVCEESPVAGGGSLRSRARAPCDGTGGEASRAPPTRGGAENLQLAGRRQA